MKLASEILNLEVFSLYEKEVVGVVKNIVIDPTNGNLIAVSIYGKEIKKGENIISGLDIRHIDPEILIIESKGALGSETDLPRAYDIIKNKINIIGSKVVTENGNYIGKVHDFALDSRLTKLARIYVAKGKLRTFFGQSLIFSYEQIVKIEKKRITVFDDTERVKRKAEIQASA